MATRLARRWRQWDVTWNFRGHSGHNASMEPDYGSLWRRVRAGDSSAFGLLFEHQADAIYGFCLRRTGERAAAEDLLSIVFLEAWRRRDKALSADKVVPWLYGIATNVVRNERRSRRRYAIALARLSSSPDEVSAYEIENQFEGHQQIQRLLGVLERLPRRQRETFVLCAWCGLSYEEAAFALGIPVGTVRSRLSRARKRLVDLRPCSDMNSRKAIREPKEAVLP